MALPGFLITFPRHLVSERLEAGGSRANCIGYVNVLTILVLYTYADVEPDDSEAARALVLLLYLQKGFSQTLWPADGPKNAPRYFQKLAKLGEGQAGIREHNNSESLEVSEGVILMCKGTIPVLAKLRVNPETVLANSKASRTGAKNVRRRSAMPMSSAQALMTPLVGPPKTLKNRRKMGSIERAKPVPAKGQP